MLRIGAGQFKGRILKLPPSSLTRPTSDRLREAVFNILSNHINLNDIRVLDAFAGSGAMGLEALSRGASQVVFCENQPKVTAILKQNIFAILKTSHHQVKLHLDLFKLRTDKPFDLVFLDPPYDQGLEIKAIDYLCHHQLFANNAVIVIEQRKGASVFEHARFTAKPARIYGSCQVTLLQYNTVDVFL